MSRTSVKTLLFILLGFSAVFGFFTFEHNLVPENGLVSDTPTTTEVTPPVITSFEGCVEAGYPVMESYPRQCRTPDGRTYAEELPEKITYSNASSDFIVPKLPYPGAVVGKEFMVTGKARGGWFFEASFPVEVLDKEGNILARVPAHANGEWMTEDFVSFSAPIKIPQTYIGPATLILKKDNPSGLPENEASISFPITIEY